MIRINLQQKYWIFLISTSLAGLYFLTDFGWVKTIVEYKLDFAPLVSVKSLLIAIFIYLFYQVFIRRRN